MSCDGPLMENELAALLPKSTLIAVKLDPGTVTFVPPVAGPDDAAARRRCGERRYRRHRPHPAESTRNPAREGRGDRIQDVHSGRRVSEATPRHLRRDKSSRDVEAFQFPLNPTKRFVSSSLARYYGLAVSIDDSGKIKQSPLQRRWQWPPDVLWAVSVANV